jgi:AcrR family transcriptional regulator
MVDPDARTTADELDSRTRLREAALDLFGRQGVRNTSTREILTAAGMRNPSAISYHFGSKAGLVDDLVGELIRSVAPVLQLQVELTALPERPTIDEWARVAVDSSVALVSTERGCLLGRLWFEYAGYLKPTIFEDFLLSDSPLALSWNAAIGGTFVELPLYVAIARNVAMLRSLEWMVARRAGRILIAQPSPALMVERTSAFGTLMLEVAVGILSAPTTLTDGDIIFAD